MGKFSFLDKLTGNVPDDYDDLFDDESSNKTSSGGLKIKSYADDDDSFDYDEQESHIQENVNELEEMDKPDAELAVDVYQTTDEIVVRALVAGTTSSNLDLDLTREMLTIKGTREEPKESEKEDYFIQELYWGTFSRTILLPEEVEVEEAKAIENHGVLTVRLPKINKSRKLKLRVKSR